MARLVTTLGLCFLGGASAAALEDDAALVQAGVHSHQQAATGAHRTRAELLSKLASQQLPGFLTGSFDCEAHPRFCQEPFNCGSVNALDLAKIPLQGIAPGGKPNMKLWCSGTQYEDYMHMCLVQKDLVKAGQIQYQWSLDQHNGVDEMDASYCFIEGHCSNEAVTNETTLEESIQMCDDRYGRAGWSELLSAKTLPQLMMVGQSIPKDMSTGFHDTRQTAVFLKMACAMGNYHCDVMYCKETYCKNPYYLKRYSHLLPKAPGHLIQQKDWLE